MNPTRVRSHLVCRLLTVLTLAGLAVWCAPAATKDGVGLSKISLPSGPGSIEGLGDSFEPQLNSGTSSYSVRISGPPGVNGLQPDLVLRYNAGSGNGHFGLGWSASQMSIQRQTEKGLPTYGPQDVFTFQGEELVSLSDGSYRVENESGFMRFRRFGEGWEVTDKSGRRHLLGTSPDARLHRPGAASFVDTFKWCLNEVIDTHGNRMEYRHQRFPDSPGDLYCTEIRYSISRTDPAVYHSLVLDYEPRPDAFASYLSGFEVRTGRRCWEIRVESRGGLVRRYELSYLPDAGDLVEAIAPSDAGLAFSLLRKLTQFDNGANAVPSHLPPLRFGYTRLAAADGQFGVITDLPPYSLADPNVALLDFNGDSLPDLLRTDPNSAAHSIYYNLGNGRFSDEVSFAVAPNGVPLDAAGTELADYDGDGRADLVQKQGGAFDRFVYYRNATPPRHVDENHPAWDAERSFDGPFPPFELNDPAVRTLDLNGDKRIDFFRTTPFGFIYFYNRGDWWEEDGLKLFGDPDLGDLSVADDVQFSKPGESGDVPNELVKLADLNGDRLLDLVRLNRFGTELELVFWPNQGHGAWGNRIVMSGSLTIGTAALEEVFLLDLNGDGLSDVVLVDFDTLTFWVNQGNNAFSPPFTVTGTPRYVRGETVLRQADINGNGSTDFLWSNWNTVSGAWQLEYFDLAPVKPNLLRVIDNGIGLQTVIDYRTTTDYYVAARESGNPWTTRLPFPSTVVSRITQSFGLDLDAVPGPDEYITDFSYYDGYYDGFEKEFRGFAFAKKIERGDDRFAGTAQEIPVHSPSTITRLAFHTGVPDGRDNNGDGQIDEFNETGGYEEEPLKGRPLWQEVTLPTADFGGTFPAQIDGLPADDAVVFTRQYQDWRIKLIHSPEGGFAYTDVAGSSQPAFSLPWATTDGKRVSFAFLAANTTEIIEANGALAALDPLVPVRGRKTTHIETEVDFFGNTLVERNYGEHSAGSTYDDERFTHSTYAFNLDAWLIGLPAARRVTDEAGQFVSESRNYYDGTAFTGLPLGQVGSRGLMHRSEQLVNGTTLPPAFSTISKVVGDPRLAASSAITTTRAQYDAFGNPTVVRDPLYTGAGVGHEKEYTYDPVFHTYVEREVIQVGNGSADLIATAGYDYGAGVMTAATNFNGHPITFHYDSFWRLVALVKPGDSTALPTQTFHYRPGDTLRGLYYDYDPAGNLALSSTADTVVSSVATRSREVAGAPGTFDQVAFTDGAGHKLGVANESEGSGQWVFKDVKRYTSRGHERDAYLPFLTSSAAYVVPPGDIGRLAHFYDAAGRAVRSVNPPEVDAPDSAVTYTRTVLLPLETILLDEEDTNPASTYFNTPHIQLNDGLGRLIGVIERTRLNDDGTAGTALVDWLTRYAYDLNDNLTHITDSQGNQKWFRYDGLKRKLFMNDPDRGVMHWTYDDGSNLRETVDAKSQRITYTYDGVNRLKTEKYHDGLPLPPWRGSPLLEGEGPGVRGNESLAHSVVYHYDTPFPNLPAGDNTVATANNVKGLLAWVEDLSGEEHTSYDARGRVERVVKRIPDPLFYSLATTGGTGLAQVGLVSYGTAFAYDSLDRLTTLTYPDLDQLTHGYNARGLPEFITGGPSGFIIGNIDYQASDQLARIDYGNGVRTTYDYDPRLRLKNLLTVGRQSTGAQTEFIHFAYEFDGASNIRTIEDRRPGSAVPEGDPRRNTQLYNYDDLYRITRAQYSFELQGQPRRNDGEINYRYDRIGNMLAQTSTFTNHVEKGLPVADLGAMESGGSAGRFNRVGRGPTDPPGPHALTQIVNPKSPIANRSYPYDANGNMTNIDGLVCTWDFKDRLVAVENAEMRAAYAYDHTDRRISKSVSWKPGAPDPDHPQSAIRNPQLRSTLYINKYFEVREHDAPVKYVWNGDTRVARVTGSLNTDVRVQRLRVWPGWNLVSLAVTATNALAQLSTLNSQQSGDGEVVSSAANWDPVTREWLPIAADETLSAGSVVWLRATTNATLTITGAYADPTNRTVTASGDFLPSAGLEAWDIQSAIANLPPATAWAYDAPFTRWLSRLPPPLELQSDLPAFIAPGQVVFARAEALATIEMPSSNLRLQYFHQDHLHSTSAISNDDRSNSRGFAYYCFGSPRVRHSGRGETGDYAYLQKEADAESSSAYFEARYLRTGISRFQSTDAFASLPKVKRLGIPQSLNVYAYCRNNPLGFVDPSGNEEQTTLDWERRLNDFGRWGSSGLARLRPTAEAAKQKIDSVLNSLEPLGVSDPRKDGLTTGPISVKPSEIAIGIPWLGLRFSSGEERGLAYMDLTWRKQTPNNDSPVSGSVEAFLRFEKPIEANDKRWSWKVNYGSRVKGSALGSDSEPIGFEREHTFRYGMHWGRREGINNSRNQGIEAQE